MFVKETIEKFKFMENLDLKQKQAVTTELINKILYSKRLLVDHVEALEHCLTYIQELNEIVSCKDNCEILLRDNLTARNTCIALGSTILEYLIIPKSLKILIIPSVVLSSSLTTLYAIKSVFIFRNKIVERQLEFLIRTVDDFGNCIRRNMTYFNEILIMKTSELIESRQCERAWDCITTVKEVTEILYDATRKLESQYPLPAKFSEYYCPMEELRECDYFTTNITDYSPKDIKDFYNIFSYVQSQFFLRFALTILQKPSLTKLNPELAKINCEIERLVMEEENHFKNLTIDINKKKNIEMNQLHKTKTMKNKFGTEALLQESSLKLSSCMIAVATECSQLDKTLQNLVLTESAQKDNSKDLVQIANQMRAIENTLTICFEDFQRLMLLYTKFLNKQLKKDDNLKLTNGNKNENDNSEIDDNNKSILDVEIFKEDEKDDDFFAYMYDDQETKDQNENNKNQNDLEILNFEKRITQSKFKPVLKQLKNRISDKRQEMLEKERKVLSAKGINIDDLFGNHEKNDNDNDNALITNTATNSDCNDDESSSNDEIDFHRTKNIKERDNFAEMRNFLAQKQAINLFQINSELPRTSSDEVILE